MWAFVTNTNIEFTEAGRVNMLILLEMIDGHEKRLYRELSCNIQSNQSLIGQQEQVRTINSLLEEIEQSTLTSQNQWYT